MVKFSRGSHPLLCETDRTRNSWAPSHGNVAGDPFGRGLCAFGQVPWRLRSPGRDADARATMGCSVLTVLSCVRHRTCFQEERSYEGMASTRRCAGHRWMRRHDAPATRALSGRRSAQRVGSHWRYRWREPGRGAAVGGAAGVAARALWDGINRLSSKGIDPPIRPARGRLRGAASLNHSSFNVMLLCGKYCGHPPQPGVLRTEHDGRFMLIIWWNNCRKVGLKWHCYEQMCEKRRTC
jgi:hypothetical protein